MTKSKGQCLLKRNDTDLNYVAQQVTACCILHNLCEIHDNSLDDSREVPNPNDRRISSGAANESSFANTSVYDVWKALTTYFATR